MRFGLILSSAFLLASTLTAQADTLSPVAGSGGDVSGVGLLYGSPNTDGSTFTITTMTGTGGAQLLQPNSFHGNQNQLYPQGKVPLDGQGFAFVDVMGNTQYTVDLFALPSSPTGFEGWILDNDGVQQELPLTFSLSTTQRQPGVGEAFGFTFGEASAVTPEPSSVALLSTGLLGAVATAWRRRRA